MSSSPRLLAFVAVLIVSSAVFAAAPADMFGDYCASCHGVDGKAHTPAGRKVGAKDLTQSKLSVAQIIQQITNGKKNERGVEKMPSFKDRLSATDIDAVAQYVTTFRK